MQVLWLRFLTEIDENTREVPEELLESPEVKRAIEVVEESAYSDAELAAYDKFWDTIRIEKAFVDEAEIRYNLGIQETKRENARRMKADGMTVELIAKYTDLTAEEIEGL
jgi:predicted transposase/invertase (TIGR01784 family)